MGYGGPQCSQGRQTGDKRRLSVQNRGWNWAGDSLSGATQNRRPSRLLDASPEERVVHPITGASRTPCPVAGCALLAATGVARQRRRGRMCGSLGSSGQLMPRSRGMRGLGTRPIRSMSGGASSAAWRSSASASLIQLTRRASASGSYGCSTSCPRGESRARTLGPRSRPVALAGGRRGTASAAPLPVRLLRSALANCGPSTCCRRASRRARAPCARPGSGSRRKPRRPAARATRSRRVVMRGLRAR